MPKPLIYSTSSDGHQNPIQPLRTGWQAVDNASLRETIRLPEGSNDHFHPTIWSRAVALNQRIESWKKEPNLPAFWATIESEQKDLEICDWITIHRGMASGAQFVRKATLLRQGGHYWIKDWSDAAGRRDPLAIPADLGKALGLKDGESIQALYHRIGDENFLLLGLGIPHEIRARFDLKYLDFLPLRSGGHELFDGELWAGIQGDWYNSKLKRMVPFCHEEHKRDIRRSLEAAAATLPELKGIADRFPAVLAIPIGRKPYHYVVLSNGDKLALKFPEAHPTISWDGAVPPVANVEFMPVGAAEGNYIHWQTANGVEKEPIKWVNLEAFFPVITADPFNRLPPTLADAQESHAADGVEHDVSEDAPDPESRLWGQRAKQFRAVTELACRIKGAEIPCPEILENELILSQSLTFELQGPFGNASRTLSARFRREEDGKPGGTLNLRSRSKALALTLFPKFQGEGWKHYWLHVGLWEDPGSLDLRPVFKDQPGAPMKLSRDSKVLHHFEESRPLAFEFLDGPGKQPRGLLLVPQVDSYPVPKPHEDICLAIDLGSSNTTVAYRKGNSEDSELVSFDLRRLYDEEPLLMVDARPTAGPTINGNPGAQNHGKIRRFGQSTLGMGPFRMVQLHLESTFLGNPRFRSYGQAHGRVVRSGYTEFVLGQVKGHAGSAWWFMDRTREPEFPVGEPLSSFMKVPTLAGRWSNHQDDVNVFGQLLPLLELPSSTNVKNQAEVFQNVFGRAQDGQGEWELLTREIKWGGDGLQVQTNNYKRAYLRELRILACAVLSFETKRIHDPEKVKVVLTHPEGKAKELNDLRNSGGLGDPRDITLVSESHANHVYFQKSVQAPAERDPFVFNLLMDMGGGTTDFSLLQKSELKAYDSLGEVRAANRVRFVGGQSLLACLARTPLPPRTGEPQVDRNVSTTLRQKAA